MSFFDKVMGWGEPPGSKKHPSKIQFKSVLVNLLKRIFSWKFIFGDGSHFVQSSNDDFGWQIGTDDEECGTKATAGVGFGNSRSTDIIGGNFL